MVKTGELMRYACSNLVCVGFLMASACTVEWFENTQCVADPGDGFPDAMVCRINVTDEMGSSWSDTDTVRYAVCADVGEISFRITSAIPHFWDILEGHCLFWVQGPGSNFVARARTENVGGSNRCHYSARYWE